MISFRIRQGTKKAWGTRNHRISSSDASPVASPRKVSLSREKIVELKVSETASYFRRAYNTYLNNSAKCQLGYKEACEFYVVMSPFHTALVQNDVHFVRTFFKFLDDDDMRTFACTSLVQYENEDEILQAAIDDLYKQNWPETHKTAGVPEFACHAKTTPNIKVLQPSIPIAIAALSGSYDMVKLLLDHGADIHQTDKAGNNILHCLILVSVEQARLAYSMFKKVLTNVDNMTEKRMLALKYNKQGHRPLDLAAKEIAPKIVLFLLRCDGVYRFSLKKCGPFQHVLYDVSDYEKHSCEKIHLLKYATAACEAELESLNKSNFFKTEPIKTWIEAISETQRARVVLWYLYWTAFLVLYFFSLAHYLESEGQPTPFAMSVSLLLFGIYEVVGQTVLTFTNKESSNMTWQALTRKGLPVAFTSMYRLFQATFGLTVVSVEAGHLLGFTCTMNEKWYAYGYITCTWWAFMSMFVFLLQSSSVGHLVIILEKMLFESFLFLIIGSVYFFIFPFAFMLLHTEPKCATQTTQALPNKTEAEAEGTFTDSAFATYDAILLSLGITVPDPLYFQNAQLPHLSIALYMMMLFWIGIAMLNQLIAVMTDRVGQINQNKQTIMDIQHVSTALFLSGNSKLGGRLLVLINRLLCVQKKDNHFTRNSAGTQVFLHVIEIVPCIDDVHSEKTKM